MLDFTEYCKNGVKIQIYDDRVLYQGHPEKQFFEEYPANKHVLH